LKELEIIVVSAVILSFLIKTFFFQSFWIPSSSMEPTLNRGDRILVTKWRPGPMDLRRGDVVVFKDPGDWLKDQPPVGGEAGWLNDVLAFVGLSPGDVNQHLVKRVIGLPGDTVECPTQDGPVYVNGKMLSEPYVVPDVGPCNIGIRPWEPWSVTVPKGYVWVMGDNRINSSDSRYHMDEPGDGAIFIKSIVGAAFVVVWPTDDWGGIGNPLAGAQSSSVNSNR
jgi:signal peptidase I